MKIFKRNLIIIFLLLVSSITMLLVACNSLPLSQPEQSEATPLLASPVANTPSTQNPTVTTDQNATADETSTPINTPLSISSIRAGSKTPLSFDGILTATGTKPGSFLIRGWTQEEGLILQTGFDTDNEIFWAISPDTGQAQQLTNWSSPPIQSNEVLVAIDNLKKVNSRINVTTVSPDGQWVAGGIIDEPVLLVEQVGGTQSPVSLLSETEWGWFAQFMTWSPNSQRLAYVVGPGLYEIRVSNPIKLWDALPSKITWSPDGHFMAFTAPEEPQHPTDVYVVGVDGANLTNITNDDERVSGPIAWSPDGNKIAYSDHSQIWLVEIVME